MSIDPQSTALLVLDYQPAVLGSFADADELLSRAARAVAVLRRRGGHIGYVRMAFDDDDFAAVPTHSPLAPMIAAARARIHDDSPTSAVHGRIAPEPGDIVVRKTRIGAFSTTDLDVQLRRRGITTLILIGVATSGVVLSTVRDAVDRDYRVYVLADASTDHDPEVHNFLIEKVFPGLAQVSTTTALDGLFTEDKEQ